MYKKGIYLDGAANTPLDPKVYKAMKPFLSKSFVGNSFAIHEYGVAASCAIEDARKRIAYNLGGFDPSEIFFTSGATESNNWILKSLALAEYEKCQKDKDTTAFKKHLIVSKIEHSSVMSTCKFLEDLGFSISYIKPTKEGNIEPKAVKRALRPDTLLVCIMAVNNETGVINDINEIGKIVHENGSLMFSDCTQLVSLGKHYIDLYNYAPEVDYFSFSAHKIYGPTGVGCLIARKGTPLHSFIHGGGQESGFRAGTSNTAGIMGMDKAIEIAAHSPYILHYMELNKYLIHLFDTMLQGKPKINFPGGTPNILSVDLGKLYPRENPSTPIAAILSTWGIACSAGSACDSQGDHKPSHVLKAQGLSIETIYNTVRISFTKYTTKKDLYKLCKILKDNTL